MEHWAMKTVVAGAVGAHCIPLPPLFAEKTSPWRCSSSFQTRIVFSKAVFQRSCPQPLSGYRLGEQSPMYENEDGCLYDFGVCTQELNVAPNTAQQVQKANPPGLVPGGRGGGHRDLPQKFTGPKKD